MTSLADASAEKVAMALRSIRLVGKFFSLWSVERPVLEHLEGVEDFLVRSYWSSVRRKHNIADCTVQLLRLSDLEVEDLLCKFKGTASSEPEDSSYVSGAVSPLDSAWRAETVASLSSASSLNKIKIRRCATSSRIEGELNYTRALKGTIKMFYCRSCSYVSKRHDRMKKHQMLHSLSRPLVCPQCSCRFLTATELSRHLRNTHLKGPGRVAISQDQLTCIRNRVLAEARRQAARHPTVPTSHRPYFCALCSFRTDLFKKLELHQLCHDRRRPFACDRCDSEYYIQSHLDCHRRAEHPEKPPKAASRPASNFLRCRVVGCDFSSYRARLVSHLKMHTSIDRPLKCKRCPCRFKNKGNLRTHQEAHEKRDRLKNVAAGKLNRALGQVHTRPGQIHGQVPGQGHPRPGQVHGQVPGQGHPRLGQVPAQRLCSVCKYKAPSASGLLKHARVHHPSRKFTCDRCTYRMPTENELINHKRRAHGDRYECRECPLKFTQMRMYKRHKRMHLLKLAAEERPDVRDGSSDPSWMVQIPSDPRPSVNVPDVSAEVCVPSPIPVVVSLWTDKKIDRADNKKIIPVLSVSPMRQEQANVINKKHKAPSSRFIPDGVHRCQLCAVTCDTIQTFILHSLSHGPALRCSSCPAAAADALALKRHMMRHFKRAPVLACHECKARCRSALWLRRHLCGHRRGANFACEVCGHRSVKYHSLLRHVTMHDPEQIWNGSHLLRLDRLSRKAPEEPGESRYELEDNDPAEENCLPEEAYRTVDIDDGPVKLEPEETEDASESKRLKSYPVISEVYSVVAGIKRELEDSESLPGTDDSDQNFRPLRDLSVEFENEKEAAEVLRCAECSFASPSTVRMAQHDAWHAGGCPSPCDVCGSRAAGMARHLKMHSKLRPLKCKDCFYKFVNRSSLTRHWKYAHEVPNKVTSDDPVLARESSDSTDRQNDVSDFAPEDEDSLLRVRVMPPGDASPRPRRRQQKKRDCDVCGFIASSHYSLNRHMAVHDQSRPIRCHLCPYNFFSEALATRHMREAHGEPHSAVLETSAVPENARYLEPNTGERRTTERTSEYLAFDRISCEAVDGVRKEDSHKFNVTTDHPKEIYRDALRNYLMDGVMAAEHHKAGGDPKIEMSMNCIDVDDPVSLEGEESEFIDYSLCEVKGSEAYKMPADCDDAEYAKPHPIYSREIDRDESSKTSLCNDEKSNDDRLNCFCETEAINVAVTETTS